MWHHGRYVLLLLFLLTVVVTQAQEVTIRRLFNVTLNTSAPAQLGIDRGRLIWRETNSISGNIDLRYYSGAGIFLLDSNLAGLTAAISGDDIVWNTSGEVVKVFDTRNWVTSALGQSYNPDFAQPVAVHNGYVAYARRRVGTGTQIVLRGITATTDTLLSAGVWNTSPSLHHGQVAWVAADSEASTTSSNILFFDGTTTRNVSNTTNIRNHAPVLRDGQVVWLQTGNGFPRVKLFTGDTLLTLSQSPDAASVVAGYDASNAIAAAAITDTVTKRSTITIYNSETGGTTTLSDSNGVTSLHISSGIVAWQSGTGPAKRLHIYSTTGASLEDVAAAENPVIDHDIIAWTLGDAVSLSRLVTYTQLTTDGLNGWQQTKFKTIDSSRVVLGNFANAVSMRLFAWENGITTRLADSSVTNDLVMANDGYIIWRRNFDSLFYYDGLNPPVKFLDTVQAENPYVAGGSIGFFGSRTTVPENIKHIWLYRIQPPALTRLASDSGFPGNVICHGNTACWLNGNTERLMFYNGTTITALSDSLTSYDYSYRNGKIVWSERLNGVYQIRMYDVAGQTTTQVTAGPVHKVYPLTDGQHVVWYEHPGYPTQPADIIMWWHDIATGRSWPVAHSGYSGLFWNWMTNGKIAWASDGNVFVYDGDVLTKLTNDDFSVNSGVYLDREMLVWRRTPPPPAVNNGQIFTGKLHPRAAFDAFNIDGSLPLTVSFTNRSWEGVRTYSWDFGDGATSSDLNPVHTYIAPGNYAVTLTVSGPTGTVMERKYRLVRVKSSTEVEEDAGQVPLRAMLMQNYPNPFNPMTTLTYQLSGHAHVTVKVYDLLGREVTTLVNEDKPPGLYNVQLDATRLASGVYFCRMQTRGYIETRKLIVLR